MGAGKWKPEHAEFLRNADVVILPDNDEAGLSHADVVGQSLQGIDVPPARPSLADETNRGRFAAVGAPVVIGAKPSVASQYPAASSAHQTSLPAEKTGAAVAVAKRALPFFDWKRDARAA